MEESTPTPFFPFVATTNAQNVNLRVNPGYLFPVFSVLAQGTQFSVTGRTPGNDWYFGTTGDGKNGWILGSLLDSPVDLLEAPLIEPGDVLIIRGYVHDGEGKPINGVQMTITEGIKLVDKRNDAVTDADGRFYFFMPRNTSGVWQVQRTAVFCESVVMDENCQNQPGWLNQVTPELLTITLPDDLELEFTIR
jgi:uncharacterized protein YgiM (DUF1202 family)